MQKTIRGLTIFFIGFMFAACNDEGVIVLDDYIVKTIEPLHEIDSTTGDSYFYENFSEGYQLIPAIWNIEQEYKNKSFVWIIDSEEKLNKINPFLGHQIDIDFSKYTLIGGRFINGTVISTSLHPPPSLIFKEKKNNYSIAISYTSLDWTATDEYYFWRLYPKLKDGKDIDAMYLEVL